MSFNQKEYINRYNTETYKMYPLRVRRDSEFIINKLSSVKSVNKYITTLIENDISPNVLTIKQIKQKIIPILNQYGIKEIYLFGSYSRGEANKDSDVDIYCDSGDINTFIDQGKLEEELENSLHKKVDLVFIGSKMDEYFKQQIDEDKIKLC